MPMMPCPELDHSRSDIHNLFNCCISAHQWINHSPPLPHLNLVNYNDDTCSSNCNEHLRGFFDQPTQNPPFSQVIAQDLWFPGPIQNYNGHVCREAASRFKYPPKIFKEEISILEIPTRLHGAIIHDHDHNQPYEMMIDEKILAIALQNRSHDLLLPPTEDLIPKININISTNAFANYFPSNMMLPTVMNTSLPAGVHTLDVLAASRLNAVPFGPTCISNSAMMQQLFQSTCSNQQKVPSELSEVAGKRGIYNSILENKTISQSHQDVPTDSRLEPCSTSFSSFKAIFQNHGGDMAPPLPPLPPSLQASASVRKEKLGDRIAALQQLVAPFGKTDTASVLMEAIGYIKFLQDQVETLSVPYLRQPKSKKQRTTTGEEAISENKKEEEATQGQGVVDLRSRGLCLVPLSCTSYVTNENGPVWSSPSFNF